MVKKKRKLLRKRHRLPIRKDVKVGAPPGSLSHKEDGIVPLMHVLAFGPDVVEERQPETAEDLKKLRDSQSVVWLNVDGVSHSNTVRTIGEVFGLHPLALEDVTHIGQRPKAEDYGDHLYIVIQMPQVTDRLELEQMSIFLGKDFVITFQERPGDCLEPVRERIRHDKGRIRRGAADYLAYAVVDAVVDTYFPALERYGTLLDTLENQVMGRAGPETNVEIHSIRQELSGLRRPLWALRETLSLLRRNDGEHFQEETQLFLRDCLDHTSQLMDIVESCREMGASLMDFHLSNMSHRMNEVMKVLTIIATVFIPLSFIAGVYGMNFERSSPWNMPELGWAYGYPFAVALMSATAAGFIFYLRRKGWLGGEESNNDNSK